MTRSERRPLSPKHGIVGLTVVVAATFTALAANRAWTQVRQLDLEIPPAAVQPGWSPRVSVVTSGRAPVTIILTLTQGARTDTISVHSVGAHPGGVWDPRYITRSFSPSVTPTQSSHFSAGPALLRAEARGRPLWLREPAPVVREVSVTVARL